MNNEPISSTPKPAYTWRQRAVVAVPLTLGVVALLVACGGAGSDSDTSLASKGDKKTAQAIVPGQWVGRAPKPESKNGITVPPLPNAAANDVSLSGVDSNANGVRDDVERAVAGSSKKSTYELQTASIARLYNRLTIEQLAGPDVVLINKQIYCLDIQRSKSERDTLSTSDILYLTANTSQRQASLQRNLDLLSSTAQVQEIPSCN